MTENTTTEEQVYHNKNNSEMSAEDINISDTIVLKEYQPFIVGEYYFVIGILSNEALYFECKKNDKYYKLPISKKNLCIINDKFNTCKDIDEIYKLILDSINKKQINITTIKNNKLKFTLSVTIEDTPYPFEIILKEEKNKNAVLLNDNNEKEENSIKNNESNSKNNESNSKNNDFALIKDNDEHPESKNEKSSSANEDESQEINHEIPSDHNHNIEFNLLEDDLNNGQTKNEKINLSGKEEDNEDEEDEDGDDPSETTNKENENNNIYSIINELKKDIKYLKGIIDKNEQTINDEKINELEIKNENLMKEINNIKNDLKTVFEENKKNKEEINILKKSFYSIKPSNEVDNNISEENNTIKDLMGLALSNNQLIKPVSNEEANHVLKSTSRKKLKKKKKVKSKSQRKSVVFRNNEGEDDIYGISEFIFKQKYKIKENDSELDLTNKKIGDKGLEALSQIKFHELKTLSLDTNGIFNIKPLTNLTLNHLEVLNLDNNYISNIGILEYCKFPSLQILWLNNNNIIDISVLERVKFNQLQHLYLNNNNINDISVFKKVFLSRLERLYLKNNRIEDISCMVDINISKLQLIYLNQNRIDFNLNTNKEIIKRLKKKIKYLSY